MSTLVRFGRGKKVRRWEPFPKQAEFLAAQEDEVFFGGAAGPGKSEALLIYSITRRLRIPGSRGLYLRREFPMLERSIIPRSHVLLAGTGAKYNATHHYWSFPNGSVLEFGHMYEKHDMYAYQGSEYEDIVFDELTEFEEEQYVFMLSRARTTKPGVRPQIRAASNPLGTGHGWVKARFVDPAPRGGSWSAEVEIPGVGKVVRTFRYIPATVFDNPLFVQQNPEYIAQLMSMPEPRRSAYLYGDWDVYEGSFFAEYSREKHVVEPFDVDGMVIGCGLDWGFAKPYCVLWCAVDHDNRLFVVDELYGWGGKPDVGSRETVPEVARKIKELEERRGYRVTFRVGDPSIWSKQGHAGPSIGEEFMNHGLVFQKADNDRIQGWNQVHMRLKHGSLKFFDRCHHLLRTLPALPPNSGNPEDLDTNAEDHAADALRYLCVSRPIGPEPVVPPPKKLPWALQTDEPQERDWFDW